MNAICWLRVRYVKAGYEPIPCLGKRPVLPSWSTAPIEINCPVSWGIAYPDATNTGIRTKRTPAIDIDVVNADLAEQIEDELRALFPQQHLVVRYGSPPKRLIPFRCEAPFTKIMIRFKAPDSRTVHKVEVLADGQQFIADGVHPDTGKPYTWQGGDLLSVPHERLPLLDLATARCFIGKAAAVMTMRQKVSGIGSVNMIQIDPITAYLGFKQMDSFRTTDVRAVLGPVTELASELKVSIVGIMHFNKKTDVDNALLRISDSLAFGARAMSLRSSMMPRTSASCS
jgi:hypothetical protein